jgi:hypothetical protein
MIELESDIDFCPESARLTAIVRQIGKLIFEDTTTGKE